MVMSQRVNVSCNGLHMSSMFHCLGKCSFFLVKHCEELGVPSNGHKSSNDTGCDSTVEFSCSECYELIGDSQLTCYPNGSWSSDEPSCQC